MKKQLLTAFFVLWASLVHANVPCTVPFNLQNNTIADATQVMANYNALIACLANAAAAGSNNDITALLGLSTPLGPTFGGTSAFIGGTSSGTNTQVVTVTPSSFSLTQGYKVSFTVGSSNTGAATLNVNATGAIPVVRHTQGTVGTLVGNELSASARVVLEYDGANWQLVGPTYIVGQIFDHGGLCPPGTLPADSTAVSRTTFSALFSIYGTTWGPGDGSTTFNLPDLRDRATYGQDRNVGGLSNRITVAGNNFDGTVIGNAGGLQNSTALIAHNHTATDSGHTHPLGGSNGLASLNAGASWNAAAGSVLTSFTVSGTGTANITVGNAGAGTSYSILGPAAIVSKCIQG